MRKEKENMFSCRGFSLLEVMVIRPGGNGQISFNPTILDAFSTALGGKVKSVNRGGGGGNKQPYITSTRVTVC